YDPDDALAQRADFGLDHGAPAAAQEASQGRPRVGARRRNMGGDGRLPAQEGQHAGFVLDLHRVDEDHPAALHPPELSQGSALAVEDPLVDHLGEGDPHPAPALSSRSVTHHRGPFHVDPFHAEDDDVDAKLQGDAAVEPNPLDGRPAAHGPREDAPVDQDADAVHGNPSLHGLMGKCMCHDRWPLTARSRAASQSRRSPVSQLQRASALSTQRDRSRSITRMWPIFRPGRAWALPQRCTLTWGSCIREVYFSRTAGRCSPRILSITAGTSCSVDPRPSPATARIACSNWDVAQASRVKWPELCGRGASSLTTISPPGRANISTASTPTSPSPSAMSRAASTARSRTFVPTRAGAMERWRMPRRCSFSTTG